MFALNDSRCATYDYTDNGFQRTVIDANGNRAQLSYDGFDRQSRWEFPLPSLPSGFNPSTPASALSSAGASNAGDYESYGYDANGNRTSWRKRDGRAFAYGFDALNRMTVKTVPDGCAPLQVGACPPAAATRDVYYGYDAWGRQTAARYDAAGGADGIANGYDGFGRLTASSSSLGGITQALGYGYDADGNRVLVVHPDSVAFSYGYDGLDRLTGIAQGATALTARSYNARGELTAESRGAVATSYGHDPISRLTSLHDELAGTSADVTSGYQYNPAGQIVIRTRDNDGYASSAYRNVDEAYQRNGLNQYTQVGTAPFGYDAAGNLVIGDDGYGYDAENRLIAVSGGHAATLGYDPLGRLWSVAGASATTRFVHDGDALALEYDGAGTLLRRYVHGNGEDDPLLWYEGAGLSDKRSLQVDHQGSIVSVADASGNPLEIDSYDEYGTRGTANTARFQFTGQVWLGEAGLYYYKARFYDPRIGRFLQVDPIGYKDQLNLYAYVANDPVNGRDPTGTQTIQDMQLQMQIDDMRQQGMSQQQIDKVIFDQGVMQAKALIAVATLAIPVEALVVKGIGWAARAIGITEKVAPVIKAGSAGGETAGKIFPQAVKGAAKAENPTATCVYCRRPGTGTQVDHAIPRARGGNATPENAQLACPHCNASKGAGEFPKSPPPGYRGKWPPDHR